MGEEWPKKALNYIWPSERMRNVSQGRYISTALRTRSPVAAFVAHTACATSVLPVHTPGYEYDYRYDEIDCSHVNVVWQHLLFPLFFNFHNILEL